MYDTELTSDEEALYEAWKKTLPPYQQYDDDYDLRGYAKSINFNPHAEGHMTDVYKKPNHITFSAQSRYSDRGQTMRMDDEYEPSAPQGGYWFSVGDNYMFVPTEHNKAVIRALRAPYGVKIGGDILLDLPIENTLKTKARRITRHPEVKDYIFSKSF